MALGAVAAVLGPRLTRICYVICYVGVFAGIAADAGGMQVRGCVTTFTTKTGVPIYRPLLGPICA